MVPSFDEDDDFDEFNEEDWDEFSKDVADSTDVWVDNWETPEEDEFTRHLRDELHNRLQAQQLQAQQTG
jgi:hypothetical protein